MSAAIDPSSAPTTALPSSKRRSLKALSALVGVVLIVSACTTSETDEGSDEVASLDEVVIVSSALPTSFAYDGPNASTAANNQAMMATQATLIRNPYIPDELSGEIKQDLYDFEGVLAESYEVSEDGLVYTFNLRQGVISPQGNEFTADDVIWSWERKFGAPTSAISPAAQRPVIVDPARQIAKVDDYTVTFTVDKPGYGFTLLGLLAGITSQVYDSTEVLTHATPDDPWGVEWTIVNANFGFGAYTVESFTEEQEITFAANPDYVLGEPEAKRITVQLAPEAGNRVTALRNGDADIAQQLPPLDAAELDGGSTRAPVFDFNVSVLQITNVVTNAPFDDPLVRQALAYAVPYDQIIDDVYGGRALRTNGLLDPAAPGYAGDDLTSFEYEPERARELLEEAGYPDGLAFTLTLQNTVPAVQNAAIAIQSYAIEAGFDISLEELPPAAYNEGRAAKTFQAFLHTYNSFVMSPEYTFNLYYGDVSTNGSGFLSEELQAFVDAGSDTGDPLSAEAGEYWASAMEIGITQAPYIFIARVQPDKGYGAGVSGIANRTDSTTDFTTLTAVAD